MKSTKTMNIEVMKILFARLEDVCVAGEIECFKNTIAEIYLELGAAPEMFEDIYLVDDAEMKRNMEQTILMLKLAFPKMFPVKEEEVQLISAKKLVFKRVY